MKCSACGSEIDGNLLFCPTCGEMNRKTPPVESGLVPEPVAAAPFVEQDTEKNAPVAPYPASVEVSRVPVQDAQVVVEPSSGNGRKKTLLVIVAVLCISAVALCIALFGGSSKPIPASTAVSSNGASVQADESSVVSSSSSDSDRQGSATASSSGGANEAQVEKESDREEEKSYILADSDSRYYGKAELEAMDLRDLYLARNEIFARHGRGFKNEDLQQYFESKEWYSQRYSPIEFDSMDTPLNDCELKNSELMLQVEQERDSPYLVG